MVFSIIVPVYNTEQYLNACLSSIFAQDFPGFELLLVDDGSTDASGAICDAWAGRETRVKVFHIPKRGIAAARNVGLKNAEGDYVVFLDSDDVWLRPSVLSELSARLQSSGADVLSYNFVKRREERDSAPYFRGRAAIAPDADLCQALQLTARRHLWIACAWNKAVRRSLIEQQKLYFDEGTWAEDIRWCARLLLAARKIDFLDLVAVAYRQRVDSTSKTLTEEKVITICPAIMTIAQMLEGDVEPERAEVLRDYLAYLVGAYFADVAAVESKRVELEVKQSVRQLAPYMKQTRRLKVRGVYLLYRLLGYAGVLRALRLRY